MFINYSGTVLVENKIPHIKILLIQFVGQTGWDFPYLELGETESEQACALRCIKQFLGHSAITLDQKFQILEGEHIYFTGQSAPFKATIDKEKIQKFAWFRLNQARIKLNDPQKIKILANVVAHHTGMKEKYITQRIPIN